MDKFLNIPEQDLVVNVTSITQIGSAGLSTTSSTAFDNVSVGDIVHEATTNKYYLVSGLIDGNQLNITALDGGAVPILASKECFIHSATTSKSQLVSCAGIGLIEQASTSTVTITFDDAAASDVVTITHVPLGSGSEAMRDAIQNEVISALQTSWTSVSNSVALPKQVIGVSIG